MITTKNKAATKISRLEKGLSILVKTSNVDLVRKISEIYHKEIHEISRNVKFFYGLVYVPKTWNYLLGNINLKRIEEFVKENTPIKED